MLVKRPDEIKKLKEGGKILGSILSELIKMVKPGVSSWDIDKRAEELILKAGGRPSFKGYTGSYYDPPFPCTICASVNQGLVHGIAKKDFILQEGDNIGIDIGMEYPFIEKSKNKNQFARGWYTDTAVTVAVGEVSPKVKELMRVVRQSLEEGIKVVKPGNSVADIGRAIENYVKKQGKYGIVRDLVGHGVGHEVHEEPRIPNYYDKNLEKFILKPGMVLALEPMVSLGTHDIKTADDGWTIEMADGEMCAHYEHTVVVTKGGCEVITRRPKEKLEKLF